MKKFEPKKPEKEVISLRLDSRMLEEINSWAIEIDISRNEFINQCIDFALKNIDTDLVESVERKHNTNGRGGRSQIIPKLRTGFEEDEENQKKDEGWRPHLFLGFVFNLVFCFTYYMLLVAYEFRFYNRQVHSEFQAKSEYPVI